jgi:serine/threonine-protein kinase HipA
MSELLVVIDTRILGCIRSAKGGRLSFEYDSEWLDSSDTHTLSVSMPLGRIIYAQRVIYPYLWNLLPENPNVLARWATQYKVSQNNPFALLKHVGADVPGAAQFIPAERLAQIQAEQKPTIDWITKDELAGRLRDLRQDISAVRKPGDIGKMSLPGVQAKTGYYWDEQRRRWGVPGGRTPTTHIIKPCIPGYDGLVENEHLCQEIAARLGLAAARTSVLKLDETYIVIERFDRLPPMDGSPFMKRVHQEDMCQALALMPGRKYQEAGGPGVKQIVTLIRRVSAQPHLDVDRFIGANIFNWLIGGTDAHAKNYALLIDSANDIRLAPLYDLSSQLPYPEIIEQKLAMKIGSHYEIPRIGLTDWKQLATECALEEDRVIEQIISMAAALPDHVNDVRKKALEDGLNPKVIRPLASMLISHARELHNVIKPARPSKRTATPNL